MIEENKPDSLRLAIPTGRPEAAIIRLLADAGLNLENAGRSYRPQISLENVEVKRLKPRTVAEMLRSNIRDVGFTGADWAYEAGGDLIELCDTGLDRVKIVAAAPENSIVSGVKLRVASEYQRITTDWAIRTNRNVEYISSRGTTEVFPPEEADAIVDCISTGQTLAANNLIIFDDVFDSSTRLFASPEAMRNSSKRRRIEDFSLMINAACNARQKVMLELNCAEANLNDLLSFLPSMRSPTVSKLSDEGWFAVKTSIARRDLSNIIPRVRNLGGCDIIVTQPYMVIP